MLAFPNDGSGLFDNLAGLVPASQVHLLGFNQGQTNGTTNEWVDRFQSFSQQTGFQYRPITNTVRSVAPADDRRINKNAIFPQGTPNPIPANGLIHRDSGPRSAWISLRPGPWEPRESGAAGPMVRTARSCTPSGSSTTSIR